FRLHALRPLPTSPRFPYTTLFRSRERLRAVVGGEDVGFVGQQDDVGSPVIDLRGGGARVALRVGEHVDPPEPAQQVGGERVAPEDRKSTRLNSSHVKISYAVLCLK